MTKSDNKLDKRLEDLGCWLQSKPSYSASEEAEHQLDSLDIQSKAPHRLAWKRPGWSMAACLLVGMSLWFFLTGPESLTYADVQRSLDNKPWVLIRYDSGAQEWVNLSEQQSFYTYQNANNFYVGMRNHTQGLYRAYHSNWGEQIHEESFTPITYPQTPWEYAVGGWASSGPSRVEHSMVKRSSDVIDDRKVIRFDTYNLGPLDLRVLARTVWADPETRLPVRICKYADPERDKEPDIGNFSFPETGPNTIYDLNAPQGLPYVTNWGINEPAAQALIDTAKQKQQESPRKMRIVKTNRLWVTICYRCDDKVRSELYGHVNESRNDFVDLEIPKDVSDIREWARLNLSLLELDVFDGVYEYSYHTAIGQSVFEETDQPVLRIHQRSSDWIHVLIPWRDQWPYVSHVGPMRVIHDEPNLPGGCVLLQYEGTSHRYDWIADTQRDHICVKLQEYRRTEPSDSWVLQGGTEGIQRSDLVQLSTGQWYAQTIKSGYSPSVTRRKVDLMTEADMAALAKGDIQDFFNGETLIKQARKENADITFWAR